MCSIVSLPFLLFLFLFTEEFLLFSTVSAAQCHIRMKWKKEDHNTDYLNKGVLVCCVCVIKRVNSRWFAYDKDFLFSFFRKHRSVWSANKIILDQQIQCCPSCSVKPWSWRSLKLCLRSLLFSELCSCIQWAVENESNTLIQMEYFTWNEWKLKDHQTELFHLLMASTLNQACWLLSVNARKCCIL